MRLKCIDNKNVEGSLTIGDIYSGEKYGEGYKAIDDDGIENAFYKTRFEVLEDDADMVNHPNHYNYKSVECKDIIDVMCEGLEGSEAYEIGAAIKYLYRYPKKGNAIQDLKKAITYIKMIIDKLESEE